MPPAARLVPTTGVFAAPVEAPSRIEPEAGLDAGEEGVQGGVEGGVPDGVLGGIVGGLPTGAPPPPPPAPVPKGPVRVGGEIKTPALVLRVEPVYPPFAMAANIQGTVILEAVVDEQGAVQDVKVLRSQGLLDRAAIAAVRQWRYSPLLLNGRPEQFVLTVVLTFSLEQK
jgi:protein TonB